MFKKYYYQFALTYPQEIINKNSNISNFTFNNSFCKQIDGSTIGGSLSVKLSDIYGKIEIDVVCPLKPLFYSRYVDDIYNRHRKDEYDQVFSALNNCHDNIKFTIELTRSKLLYTQLIKGKYITKIHRKYSKTPIQWSSKISINTG